MSIHEIYDIGTEILIFHCFATNIIKPFCKSIIFSGVESARRDLAFYSIKTWFKALWGIFSKICMRPWIRSLSNISPKSPLREYLVSTFTKYSPKKAPAGILREPFYKILKKKAPAGIFPKHEINNLHFIFQFGHLPNVPTKRNYLFTNLNLILGTSTVAKMK